VAIVFAVIAVFIISAGSGYAIKSATAPATQSAPAAVRQAVQGGPMSDLTRALPGQPTGSDTNFDTCTQLVHKAC
jgi:hypothetical protein